MPTVKGIPGRFRFFFFSSDCKEPKHVHVRHERRACKFWLEPLTLARNYGFAAHELAEIRELIRYNLRRIMESWDEHCD